MKIDKYIKSIISDHSRSLKERVFVVLTFAAIVVCAFAVLGDIVYGDSIVEIITLIVTIIGVPLITITSVHRPRSRVVSPFRRQPAAGRV